MAQETELWERETNLEREQQVERKPDEDETGRDMPSGDGGVGDEQVNRIDHDDSGRPTGQDHSTDIRENREPSEGVGAVQDSNLLGTDVADISE